MLEHLWTRAPAPAEYIAVKLASEWHMPPSQVLRLPLDDWLMWSVVHDAIAEVNEAERGEMK